MKRFSRWLAPRTQGAIAALLLAGAVAWAGVTNYDALQLDPLSADTNSLLINNTSGTAQVTVTKAGAVTFAGAVGFTGAITETLAAGAAFLIDAATTAHTGTAGALDINSATVTANASGIDVLQTTNNGTVAATDTFIGNFTMTQNDADADAFGFKMTASATANAAAGSYEYGYFYDCAENTAGACLDGILITSSGVDAGLTDGLDVSAANITNGVNLGSNLILGGNADSLTIGATDNTLTVTADAGNTAIIQGADAAGAANTLLDTTGAGAIGIGSADVTAITLTTDSTGDGEVVLPGSSVSAGEIVDLSRDINIPIRTFFDCQTDGGLDLPFVSGVDTVPNFFCSNTDGLGCVLRFDDTAATEDQNSEVCSNFVVPATYVSGGRFMIQALKDAHAGATEVINCAVSVNGAALQVAGTVTTTASASTAYTCTPTIAALVPGDAVSFYLDITSATTMDDTVDLQGVSFQYTASE